MISRFSTNRSGITLPELLTVIVVLGIILGSVVSIYQISMRTWREGMLENMAQQRASWVIQRMAQDIRMGMAVTPGTAPFESSYIALRLPNRIYNTSTHTYYNQVDTTVDGTGIYLVAGDWVIYYRGDADGNLSTSGDRIWRRYLAADGTTVLRTEVVSDNVIDNPLDETGSPKPIFIFYPDMYHMKSIEVTVTAQERMGIHTAQSTMNSELALRNLP
jgi:prepilin-type N-terminal cleavage/methylation domain-containing protein